MLMNKGEKYVAEKLNEFIAKSGDLVTPEEEAFRINKCKGCEYNGIVEPVPGIKVEGCTKCQCPFGSKRKMKSIPRLKNKEDAPLTAMELIKIKVYGIFDKQRLETKIIKCSHPDGNKWAGFKNNKIN